MTKVRLLTIECDWRRVLRGTRKVDVVSILATGGTIGLLTASFALVNSLVIRPLPFADAERLFLVNSRNERGERGLVPFSDGAGLGSRSSSFSSLSIFEADVGAIVSGGPTNVAATYARAARVDSEIFQTLEVQPEVGRSFRSDDTMPVVIVGHSLWQRVALGDPRAIGETIAVDGVPHVVLGVMPSGFDFYRSTELWLPLAQASAGRPSADEGRNRNFWILVRLRRSATLARATAEVSAIGERLAAERPSTHGGYTLDLRSLDEDLRPDAGVTLWLFGGVVLVSVLACANIAGLQLAKVPDRSEEVAVRLALGGTPRRIATAVVGESALGAIPAGAIGALVGVVVVELIWIRWFAASEIGAWAAPRLDARVLAFIACSSLLISIGVGLASTWNLSRIDLSAVLGKQSGHVTPSRSATRWRGRLAVAQIGVTATATLGALLVAQSVTNMRASDRGIDRVEGLRVRASLLLAGDGAQPAMTFENLRRAITSDPVVTAVGLHRWRGNETIAYTISAGQVREHQTGTISVSHASLGFLEATGRRLLQGRLLAPEDMDGGERSVVIEDATANRLWPEEIAVGKPIRIGARPDEHEWHTVVGVIEDFHGLTLGLGMGIQSTRRHEYAYVPMGEHLADGPGSAPAATIDIFVRSAVEEAALLDSVRRAAARVHGGLSIQRIQTLQSYADNHAEEFLGGVGLILSALAGIAATLSMIGVYGLLAQLARQRRQEIGVRRALGCSRVGAARLIVGNGLRIASLGGFMGLCAGAALAWIMQGFLYDWDSVGLAPVLVVGIGIIGLAIVASWIPGKLAASVDPLVAIRGE